MKLADIFEIGGNPIGLILTGGPLEMTLEDGDVSSGDDEQPSVEIVDFGGSIVDPEVAEETVEETPEESPIDDFAPVDTPFASEGETVDALIEALDAAADGDAAPAVTEAPQDEAPAMEAPAFETVDPAAFLAASGQDVAVAPEVAQLPFSDLGSEAINDIAATYLF